MGEVELATVHFWPVFPVSRRFSLQLRSVCINGGTGSAPLRDQRGKRRRNADKYAGISGGNRKSSQKKHPKQYASILEKVVSEGSGKNAGIEGYSIGGKTATSQTLPRGSGRYISSFLGFAPAENPTVLGLCIIYNPQGMYYGGIIAAPVLRSIFENILPYLGIEKTAQVETRQGGKSALD